ncbi:MAG: DUF262 domain-containing protein [Christensenellaceae bacterium]|jgi:hypothetical protein|nr:DUF262 domain-containing protein [Christensenellaceae bacterium]
MMANMLFTPVPRSLKDLIMEVENGRLGLPELQRGYVWKATKVRDLLDSMMKGYPIGYLMIWDTSDSPDKSKQIGSDYNKPYSAPKSLIIDGQQRLTSLFAVIRSKKIIDEKFNEKPITISFNPLTRTFEVGDNAKKRAAEWIYDIGEVFANSSSSFAYINSKVKTMAESREKSGATLTDFEMQTIQQNIMDLLSLENYSVPTLEINGNTDEESVADIFVRVNAGGKPLGEDDFILTLISVYWQEGRQKIEEFCRSAKIPKYGTAYNFLFEPSPTHIIRVSMSFGFQRARLHYAYMLLRGRDFENGVYSDNLRAQQFDKLKTVLEKVLNVETWKAFIKCVESAGFVSKALISSENALVYSYAMYLIGKHDYHMDGAPLRKLIAKWFFMTAVTGYYTGSPETDMESDLADLRSVKTSDGFISLLEGKIAGAFTHDYFDIVLPNNLSNSASRNPSWFGYCAALNVLDSKVLFSTLHTRELFSPAASGTKSALERHHLFPKAYLERIGINDDRDRNQTANFAFIEWSANIEILDDAPSEYMKDQIAKIPADEKAAIYADHALPDGWEHLEYSEFLQQRRILMAKVIKRGYERLK